MQLQPGGVGEDGEVPAPFAQRLEGLADVELDPVHAGIAAVADHADRGDQPLGAVEVVKNGPLLEDHDTPGSHEPTDDSCESLPPHIIPDGGAGGEPGEDIDGVVPGVGDQSGAADAPAAAVPGAGDVPEDVAERKQ